MADKKPADKTPPAHKLAAGDTAPAFSLSDQNGKKVSLSDFAGKKVIIYFYPAAMTPGCTKQACDFRDSERGLEKAGYVVLGISKDKVEKLKRFEENESLNFSLLSDTDLAVHHAYGTFGEKMMYGKPVQGVIRSTFVIDENGKVELALYNVKATGHVASLRAKLGLAEDR